MKRQHPSISKCNSDKVRKTSLIHGISRIDLLFMGVAIKINNRCNVTAARRIEKKKRRIIVASCIVIRWRPR